MARKRGYKKRHGKKRAFRRINKRAIKVNKPLRNVNIGPGFPAKVTATLKYVERVTLTNAAPSAPQTHNFSCNSLYDPNASGSGHQPLYFDQLMALYDQYCVILSRIKLTFTNTGTVPCYAMCYINDDTTVTPSSYTDISEQTGAKHMVLGARDSGSATRSFKLWWGATKWFGKSPLSKDSIIGSVSASPTEQVYFTLATQPIDVTTVETVYVDVELEYVAVFTELKDIASS